MDYQSDNRELARAHIQIQQYRQRWGPMEGLLKGTIFPELYRPYYPRESRQADPYFRNETVASARSGIPTAQARGGRRDGKR